MENNGENRPNSSSRQIQISECEYHDNHLARIMLEMSNELRFLTDKVHTMESIITEWVITQRDYIETVNNRDLISVKTRSTQTQSQWSPQTQESNSKDLSYAEALKTPLYKSITPSHVEENDTNDKLETNDDIMISSSILGSGRSKADSANLPSQGSDRSDQKSMIKDGKSTDPTASSTLSKVASVVKAVGSKNGHDSKKKGGSSSNFLSSANSKDERLNDVITKRTNDRKGFMKHAHHSANEKSQDVKRINDRMPMLKRSPRANNKSTTFDPDKDEEEMNDSRYLPKVVIYHDSILKHVDAEKLGKAYGCKVEKEKCYLLNQVQERMAEKETDEKPDAIVVHCGVNEFKASHPRKAAENLVSIVREYKRKTPHTPIVVSGVAPTAVADLNKKKNFFNSTVTSALFEEKDVFFIQHENLHFEHIIDRVHPNRGRGSSILATNIGRTLRNLFWVEGEKTRRQRQKKWWELNILNY